MRKVVKIGEHSFELPELTSKSEVLFKNENKANAYWDRNKLIKAYKQIWFEFIPHETLMYQPATGYDAKGMLTTLNIEDSQYIERIYEQEIRRRTEGVWFKNGDNIEYLTGDHYFLLMWAKMNAIKSNYAEFREYQRDFFYLIKKVNDDKKISGLIVSKAKKTGITNIMWTGYYLNKATLFKDKNMGCMNIDSIQAAKTFRDYFLYAYKGLPAALKPEIKSLAPQDGKIEFGKAHTNSKKNRLIAVQDADEELNTNVFCVATAPKAFDVAVMNDIWFDEYPKYKTSIKTIFDTNKEAIKMGAFLVGKIWMTSYTPEEDSQSFIEGRKIKNNSKLKTLSETKNGKTISGLIYWHIPSKASWIGENDECFDKYGRCDEKETWRQIKEGRDAVKDDSRSLQALKRQYAIDETEAWSSAGSGSTFDLIRLGGLLSDVEIEQENTPDNPYIEGNLEWENHLWELGLRNLRKKGEFCNVRFIPISPEDRKSGKRAQFRIYYNIPEMHRNLALKQGRDENGNLLPPQRFIYSLGGDPTSYSAGSEVTQGSKNGGGVMRLPDMMEDIRFGKIVTNTFDLEYYDRPELHDEAFESYLKMIIYTGAITIIEGNQSYVGTRLMQEGLGHYMIIKDADGIMGLWKPWMGDSLSPDKTYSLIKRTKNQSGKDEIVDEMIRLFKIYFHDPVEGEKDYGKTCKSDRLLHDMMDFNPLDTKLFDIFMAWGYALIAAEVYKAILSRPAEDSSNPDLFRAVLRNLGVVA